jgi:hypothetical protein
VVLNLLVNAAQPMKHAECAVTIRARAFVASTTTAQQGAQIG